MSDRNLTHEEPATKRVRVDELHPDTAEIVSETPQEGVTYKHEMQEPAAYIPQMYEPYRQQLTSESYGFNTNHQMSFSHKADNHSNIHTYSYAPDSKSIGLNDLLSGENNGTYEPEQAYFDVARTRTVTMDSILNTVTSDASINLADYSKVYSALNPPQNHYTFDTITPPLTPHARQYSSSHGLSNLNPDYQQEHQQHSISQYTRPAYNPGESYPSDYYNDIPQLFDRNAEQRYTGQQLVDHSQHQPQSFSSNPLPFSSIAQPQYQHQPLYPPSQQQQPVYNELEYQYDPYNKPVRIFNCPRPLCTKVYKNANGLKYHMSLGSCEVDSLSTDASLFTDPATSDQMAASQIKLAKRPYWCRVIGCGKRYKNLNGLKYHGKVTHADLDFTKYVKGHHAHVTDDDRAQQMSNETRE